MGESVQTSGSPEGQRAEAQEPSSAAPITPVEPTSEDSRNRESGSGADRGGRRNKRKDLGRKAWSREIIDKRARNEEQAAKRRKAEEDGRPIPIYATQFSKEDIEAEQRRPKKKVAVLMSYAGTGYHGMQLTPDQRTIEGDLFPAFVAAGAISKANAMDPKKSSLVRCARTDKGVHAAGNIVSLKLIIEDPDVVKKINEHLSPQIRVWGIEVATKSFSSYHMCDSRIYEYLIPTHCFIPPHPSTFLAQKLQQIAEEKGDLEGYNQRQADMAGYWEKIDNQYIKPILERLPEDIRQEVQDALCIRDETSSSTVEEKQTGSESLETKEKNIEFTGETSKDDIKVENATDERTLTISKAIKEIRAAYFKAKKTFRIHPDRIKRITDALALYVGTRNFHNYTIQKSFKDPSAKRLIKSFKVASDPIIINGTEWLSLKVHGQSFMMHQIRKMVAMVALIVRCGSDIELINQSYGDVKIPIPKAPGLGLLLERPIFDVYNNKTAKQFGKNPIDFGKYEKEINEFKQREIYERIFREEEETNTFGNFFNHIDTFRNNTFLYVSSGGIPASKEGKPAAAEDQKKADKAALAEVESESEDEDEVAKSGEEGG
ncbi:hypothetical protein VTO42DRAFT_9032 [Malbranchea cinnamomea]